MWNSLACETHKPGPSPSRVYCIFAQLIDSKSQLVIIIIIIIIIIILYILTG
jgi:hypothetical protein